ncbi:MAG: 50S ribosomal protein L6 [Deltaproteobacteria bacterium]|nr:50S ribosomal protein L6 [Candidatus Anaeroferrophillacea bacterium]
MSRIGKKPVVLPAGVEARLDQGVLHVKGPKGTLQQQVVERVEVQIDDREIVIRRSGDDRRSRSFHGLMRSLVNNMVTGVSTGFTRILEVNGVGYRAEVSGSLLKMSLGFSHPIECPVPEALTVTVERDKIMVHGSDKQQVGALAAKIRGYRPVEPYKGKGIKYADEQVIRKAGKAGK